MLSGKWKIREEPIYFGGQGITKGERHWYFSATGWRFHRGHPIRIWREGYILKLDLESYGIFAHRKIPFGELGVDHIGDMDFFQGLIYASLEDINYVRPRVALFREDLSVLSYSDLVGQNHFPWCAVAADGLVYTSEWDPATQINVFKIRNENTADLVNRIELKRALHKVQGGCIREDKLYVSCNDGVKGIYEVDLSSGEVLTLLETNIPYEMEGLCGDFSDETVFHFVDHEGHFYHARKSGI